MTRKTAIFLMCAALAAACGRSQSAKRAEQNYQVVEEGQAAGVTSTINGPGETPPPMLTDTAIDTTTAFTLPDNPAPLGTSTMPNTIGSTLPPGTAYPPGYYPTPQRPRPRTTAPPPMSSATPSPSAVQPQPQPQQPPPTDTQVTDEVLPPPTDTTTTSTAPPPTEEKAKEPEKTDTSSSTPPTTTSTAPPPPPPPPV